MPVPTVAEGINGGTGPVRALENLKMSEEATVKAEPETRGLDSTRQVEERNVTPGAEVELAELVDEPGSEEERGYGHGV